MINFISIALLYYLLNKLFLRKIETKYISVVEPNLSKLEQKNTWIIYITDAAFENFEKTKNIGIWGFTPKWHNKILEMKNDDQIIFYGKNGIIGSGKFNCSNLKNDYDIDFSIVENNYLWNECYKYPYRIKFDTFNVCEFLVGEKFDGICPFNAIVKYDSLYHKIELS